MKFAICAGTLWYLSDKVALNDHVRLADSPDKRYVLLEETGDSLRIRDPETGRERQVARDDLAGADQLARGRSGIELGLKSIVRRADPTWAGLGLLAVGPSVFVMGWRLRLLLGTHAIAIRLREAVLLTLGGNFLNFFMLGTTGGDVYKAYHVARHTHKRAEGVTIVLVDRVIGLISFLLLATGTILFLMLIDKPMIGVYGRWVGIFMTAFIIGACLFFSRRFRRWIHYDALLKRLPLADKLRRIDETTLSFRFHHRQTGLALAGTLVNHLLIVASIYFLAHALGIGPSGGRTESDFFLACLLASTVGFLFAAVPISLHGIGLLEAVFYQVMVEGGWANPTQMVALTFGARILQIVWSLPGLAVLWLGFKRPPPDAPIRAPG